jgi:toxin ParE1/3/4
VKLRVLQQAERETRDAAEWYEERVEGLGTSFLDEYESGLERIENDPTRFGRLETVAGPREIQRLLLRRFPYLIAYEILADEAVVLAVAHVSRRPNDWIDRAD